MPTDRLSRARLILDCLRDRPLPVSALLPRLASRLAAAGLPPVRRRALQQDLARLARSYPDALRLCTRRQAGVNDGDFPGCRRFWMLGAGEALLPVSQDVVAVGELETLALHAARALLAAPAPPGGGTADEGPLAAALGRLIQRLGLGIAGIPDIIGVNPAAPQPWRPEHALVALRAMRLGDGLAMRYRPLASPERDVAVQPVRLVLNDGEPYLWAWDGAAGKLKNWKLARVVAMSPRAPLPGVPRGLDREVVAALRHAFRGVAGAHQRARVVLRAEAGAVPHLRDRRLGPAQTWQDLPGGAARIAFNTHGLEALRHWLLQFGSRIRVESPSELAAWIRSEAGRMVGRRRGARGRRQATAAQGTS